MAETILGAARTDDERALEAILGTIEPWAGRAMRYAPVLGGISNTNWRVWVEGLPGSFFVKIPGRGTEMFIDRAAALAASRKAAGLGLGPRVYEYAADRGVEINDFIEGRRPCTNKDFLNPDIRRAAVAAYRTFNDSGLLPLTKTVFDMIDEHFEQVRSLGGAEPPDIAWLRAEYQRARAALEASGIDLAPCFNDPMPGNFMLDDAGTIMLIDYEYASNNDRLYDIGIWCGEMFFERDVEAEVIEAHNGRYDPKIHARLTVHRALADIKWSTWAMVQNEMSTLDFDFYKYGAWKHMRARWIMADPGWPDLLRSL